MSVFRTNEFDYSLDGQPVPNSVVKPNKKIGDGSAGIYYECDISPNVFEPGTTIFAVKKFKAENMPKAKHERNFIQYLQNQDVVSNNHITKFYTGFEYGSEYYLIAEKADCNLLQFMGKQQVEPFNHFWFKNQIDGLAQALADIHNASAEESTCHHDIKLPNILAFGQTEPTLKFTDFGNASHRPLTASGSVSPKRPIAVNPPCKAPESGKGISRPADVWSLGCVFLEMFIRYMEDKDSWDVFHAAREKANPDGFCDDAGKLLKVVSEKLEKLLKDPSRLPPGTLGILHIIVKMLNEDPETRIKAQAVADNLKPQEENSGKA